MPLAKRLKQRLQSASAGFMRDESGAAAIEYALVASFVAIGLVISLALYAEGLTDFYQGLVDLITP